MFYSFYTSFNVPSFNYLVEEMYESEVMPDDDPERHCETAAAFIVALMFKHRGADYVTFGVNANGDYQELDKTPVHVAVESWDYVLTVNNGYLSVSVKANAERNARFANVDEDFAKVVAELEAKFS
jgi:hypothetical protein